VIGDELVCYQLLHQDTVSYLRRTKEVMFLPVSVCLSAKLLEKLRIDFDEIFWRGGAWPKE